jgi:hypothetical protein
MKVKRVILATLMSLIVGLPAWGRKGPVHQIYLQNGVTLNGAAVPAGVYELTLETRSSNVRVTLWKDGQFFATAQGTWVKGGIKYKEDAILLRVNSDGTRAVIEIRLGGSSKSIVLDTSDAIVRIDAQ